MQHPFNPQSLFRASGAALFAKDKDSRMLLANPACLHLIGKTWEQLRGRNDLQWHTERDEARKVLANDQCVVETDKTHVCEELFTTHLGQRIILCTKAPLRNDNGEVVGIAGVAEDITERKKREEQTELSQSELKHRLKNCLALVQAFARRTLKPGVDRDDFERRLLAYARCQELIETFACGVPLHDVIKAQLLAFDAGKRVNTEGEDVIVSPQFATQIGIGLHELATNSIKYGALGSEGNVSVQWDVETVDGDRRCLQLRWCEDHGGTAAAPAHHGFGHSVLTRMVPDGLNGTATLHFSPGRVEWSLRTDLPDR